MQAAAKSNLKDVALELGGKSPLLVFADANLPKAASFAIKSITTSKRLIW
jgi:acyl-CoA reductase-like NAD-dependent aldehyde dehydrogenase